MARRNITLFASLRCICIFLVIFLITSGRAELPADIQDFLMKGISMVGYEEPSNEENCRVVINDLDPQHTSHRGGSDVIELRTNCTSPYNLDDYTVVLWRGEGLELEGPVVHQISALKGRNFKFETLPLRGYNMSSDPTIDMGYNYFRDPDGYKFWVPFQRDENQPNQQNMMAAVLYKGSIDDLHVGSVLDEASAHRSKIADLVLYQRNPGSVVKLKQFLVPDRSWISGKGNEKSFYLRDSSPIEQFVAKPEENVSLGKEGGRIEEGLKEKPPIQMASGGYGAGGAMGQGQGMRDEL